MFCNPPSTTIVLTPLPPRVVFRDDDDEDARPRALTVLASSPPSSHVTMASTNPAGPRLTSLPAELVLDIAKHLDQEDLCSLVLTCRYVSRFVQRILVAGPCLHGYDESESFRLAFANDPVARASRLTSVAFDQWSPEWGSWFGRLEVLPNLVDVALSDTGGRSIGLGTALVAFQRHPRVRTLTVSRPVSEAMVCEGFAVEALQSLILRDVAFYEIPFPPNLSEACPNVEHIEVHLSLWHRFGGANTFDDEGLLFLDSFACLTSLRLDGCFAGLKGHRLRQLLPRLRHVSLCLQDVRDDIQEAPLARFDVELGNTIFNDPCPAVESMYVGYRYDEEGDTASAALARPLLRSVANGNFPSLQRLKVVFVTACPCGCQGEPASGLLFGSTGEGLPAVDWLRSSGFEVHHCAECVYAEKPSSSRSAPSSV